MFWRKKTDGFEWHKHVRTAIKLRRENRRHRIDGLKHAAVEGLAGVGKAGVDAGVSGAARLGNWVIRPLAWINWLSGRSWRALAWMLGGIAPALAMAVSVLSGVATAALRGPLTQVGDLTARKGVAPLVALAAVVSGLLGLGSLYVTGWDLITSIEIGLAALAACSLLLPPLVVGRGSRSVVAAVAAARSGVVRLTGASNARAGPVPARLGWLRRCVGIGLIAVAVGVAGWLAMGTMFRMPMFDVTSLTNMTSLPRLPGFSGEVTRGRASALSGDTLRIGNHVLRLAGVDAPEAGQQCREIRGGGRRTRAWRCGEAAERALRDLVRGAALTCEVTGGVNGGHKRARCQIADKDIAATLVRAGHVFATPGLLSSYSHLEQQARDTKAGLWRGEAERPEAYRQRLWAVAKRAAPSGCPIKGRVVSGKRVYVVPWSPSYRRLKVSQKQGGRWFCSEEEALAAGWSPGDRS